LEVLGSGLHRKDEVQTVVLRACRSRCGPIDDRLNRLEQGKELLNGALVSPFPMAKCLIDVGDEEAPVLEPAAEDPLSVGPQVFSNCREDVLRGREDVLFARASAWQVGTLHSIEVGEADEELGSTIRAIERVLELAGHGEVVTKEKIRRVIRTIRPALHRPQGVGAKARHK
jgi:hypothetical protein